MMKNRDFILVRYSSLTSIWSHQNTVLLQWPSIVITTVLISLTILIPSQLPSLLNIAGWGNDKYIIFGYGIPLLLLGLGVFSMVYLMRRAKKVLIEVEAEILRIESEFEIGNRNFSHLNHPAGLSGIRVVLLYLHGCLAIPILSLGFLLTFGKYYGILFCLLFLISNLIVKLFSDVYGKKIK